MVKPRYINNEVIVPKPGPKQIKKNTNFVKQKLKQIRKKQGKKKKKKKETNE